MGCLMKSKSINDGVERTFVLILDQGEEAFQAITDFAEREKITGASVSAIGAFSTVKVGWFDLTAKKYKPIEVDSQCEVLSLLGDWRRANSWQQGRGLRRKHRSATERALRLGRSA